MPRSTPLPEQFRDGPFQVAEAVAAGVGRSRLRSPELSVPTHGVRTAVPPQGLIELAAAVAVALPDPWAFSHLTAVRLLGLAADQPWCPDEPLHVVRPTKLAAIRRRGVVHHRGLESRRTVIRHGLPVVGPVHTWCDLAPSLPLEGRVVLGDAVVNRWTGVRLGELSQAVQLRAGRAGARALREALPLVRPRSRSPMETVARLAFLAYGLPEPELNADVYDRHGGWLANADFVWRRWRVLSEYDGDQHRSDRRQWRHDVTRRRSLTDEGWRVHVLTADDFARPSATQRCLEAIARALDDPPTG